MAGLPKQNSERIIVQRGSRFMSNWTMNRLDEYRLEDPKLKEHYPWAERFVLTYPLFPGQRELKWSTEQSIQFLEDAWLGADIAPILVAITELDMVNGSYIENSEAIVDGQQRLNSVEMFITNQIPIFGVYFKDFTEKERRAFYRIPMDVEVIHTLHRPSIVKIYNARNFEGIAHNTNERIAR